MARECVEHFVSGQDAWQLGVFGFLSRLRGIGITLAVAVATMGIPWWWRHDLFSGVITLPLARVFIALAFVVGTVAVAGLLYLRRRAIRSLEVKNQLHELAHFIRDSYAAYCGAIKTDPALPEGKEAKDFGDFVSHLCERSKKYFARLLWDQNVAVAVRIAVTNPQSESQETQEILYCTIGRSSGLDPRRESTSEPISSNEGIARYLREKGSTGVLIYNDLEKASKMETFKTTKNEQTFSSEVQSIMVAPLNAWGGQDKAVIEMIGILFVTSRKRSAFGAKDVDSVRFIADALANAISTVVDKLTTAKRMPPLTRKVS